MSESPSDLPPEGPYRLPLRYDAMQSLWALMLFAVALAVAAPIRTQNVTPEWAEQQELAKQYDSLTDEEVVVAYSECIDFCGPLLAATIVRGAAARRVLEDQVVEGAPESTLDELEAALNVDYDRIEADALLHPQDSPYSSREEFVKTGMDGLSEAYYTRAAIALGEIGNPDSLPALRQALEVAMATENTELAQRIREVISELEAAQGTSVLQVAQEPATRLEVAVLVASMIILVGVAAQLLQQSRIELLGPPRE